MDGLDELFSTLCLRCCCYDNRQTRYRVVTLNSWLDAGSMVNPNVGTCVRSMVGLPCPGMGGLLGLGSGGECSAAAMVNSNRIPSFSDGAGTPGHAQSMESKPGNRLLCSLN